jgi:hypothetical protein
MSGHKVACEMATSLRTDWACSIVIVLFSEDGQFCVSSVAPPKGLSRSQIEYIDLVAENAIEMGLPEQALFFSLLRVQSLLAAQPIPNQKAVAVPKPTSREMVQVLLTACCSIPLAHFCVLLISDFLSVPLSNQPVSQVHRSPTCFSNPHVHAALPTQLQPLPYIPPAVTRNLCNIPGHRFSSPPCCHSSASACSTTAS